MAAPTAQAAAARVNADRRPRHCGGVPPLAIAASLVRPRSESPWPRASLTDAPPPALPTFPFSPAHFPSLTPLPGLSHPPVVRLRVLLPVRPRRKVPTAHPTRVRLEPQVHPVVVAGQLAPPAGRKRAPAARTHEWKGGGGGGGATACSTAMTAAAVDTTVDAADPVINVDCTRRRHLRSRGVWGGCGGAQPLCSYHRRCCCRRGQRRRSCSCRHRLRCRSRRGRGRARALATRPAHTVNGGSALAGGPPNGGSLRAALSWVVDGGARVPSTSGRNRKVNSTTAVDGAHVGCGAGRVGGGGCSPSMSPSWRLSVTAQRRYKRRPRQWPCRWQHYGCGGLQRWSVITPTGWSGVGVRFECHACRRAIPCPHRGGGSGRPYCCRCRRRRRHWRRVILWRRVYRGGRCRRRLRHSLQPPHRQSFNQRRLIGGTKDATKCRVVPHRRRWGKRWRRWRWRPVRSAGPPRRRPPTSSSGQKRQQHVRGGGLGVPGRWRSSPCCAAKVTAVGERRGGVQARVRHNRRGIAHGIRGG